MYTKEILAPKDGKGIEVVSPCGDVSWGAVIAEDVTKYILSNPTEKVLDNLANDVCEIKNPMFKPFVSFSTEKDAIVLTEATGTSEGGEGISNKNDNIDNISYGLLIYLEHPMFLEHYFEGDFITDDEQTNLYHFTDLLMSYGLIHEYVAEEDHPKYLELFINELKDKHLKKNVSFVEAKKTYDSVKNEGEVKLVHAMKVALGLSHLTTDPNKVVKFEPFDMVVKVVEDAYSDIESQLSEVAKKYGLRRADKELLELKNERILDVANDIARHLKDSKYGIDCTVEVNQNADNEAVVCLENWGEWQDSDEGYTTLTNDSANIALKLATVLSKENTDMKIEVVEGEKSRLYIDLAYKD